ncbi:MAG TPA: TIGR02206 family membrane protein [Flexivirga sp.]|uniref:YwaF family protein n=1 Tax=Flexivirga sp. TaxID=1962927 RepID=UPI002D06D9F1|nr:TIGR02206 family membrane protein [Flexivirga sp.]HWC23984.1 TIGR02206 family membrane protein [Flexivirga sp.]
MPTAAQQFAVLGPQHRLVLVVVLVGCAALLLLGGRLRSRPGARSALLRWAGVTILVCCAPFEVFDIVVGVQHPRTGLPLQVCDIGWLVAGVALLTRGRLMSALLYYWGLTLSIQGVVTPELDHAFPQVQFFGFWVRHVAPVWAAVLLIGLRIGPDWRGYRFSVAVTGAWVIGVMTLNGVLGSNYGYLNGKPDVRSALDLLGPWPWYVVFEVVLVAAAWALMTWPWNRRR